MATSSVTNDILNSREITAGDKIRMLHERNNLDNKAAMLNMSNKTNWDTMLGNVLGRYISGYVNRGNERRARERRQWEEQEQQAENSGYGQFDGTYKEAKQFQKDFDDIINNQPQTNESLEDMLARRHGQGQTSEALTLNPNDGTIGLERSSTFNTGLLGGTNNPAINAQFQNDLMGKNILDSMNGQAAVPEVGVINGAVNPADMANGAEAASAGGGVNLLPSILGAAKSGNVDQAAGQIAGQYAKDALGIGAANPWLLGAKLLFGL